MINVERASEPVRKVAIFESGDLSMIPEIPQWRQDLFKGHTVFCGALRKRMGCISVKDFIFWARRLYGLCGQVYQRNSLTLLEKSLLLGDTEVRFFNPEKSFYEESRRGEAVSIENLSIDTLQSLLESTSSLVLIIEPETKTEEESFAEMGWMRAFPKRLLFRGKGGSSDFSGLVPLLYKHMLVGTGLNFSVSLGQANCLRKIRLSMP